MSIFFFIGGFLNLLHIINNMYAMNRLPDDITIDFFKFIFKIFLPEFFKEVIIAHWLSIFIILILLILILKIKSEDKFLYLSFPISIFSSFILSFISLVFCGNNTFYEPGKFWFSHHNIQIFYDKGLIAIILFLLGIIYMHYYSNRKKLFCICISTLCIISLINIPNSIITYINRFNLYKIERMATYKTEKMYLYYTYKHMQPILPISTLSYPNIASSYDINIYYEDIDKIDKYYSHYFFPDEELDPNILEQIKNIDFSDAAYSNVFIKNIHKITNEHPYKFTDDELAYKYYYEAGGKFSEDELKSLNFNNLLNKDFVLGNLKP